VFKGIAAWCFSALSPSMRSGQDFLTSHDTTETQPLDPEGTELIFTPRDEFQSR